MDGGYLKAEMMARAGATRVVLMARAPLICMPSVWQVMI